MIPLNCMIVDDEPIARAILTRYCQQLSYMKVVAEAGNALEAKAFLQKVEPVDLIFLDINMPVLDGLSFLKTLRQPPAIIFTTAYREYALDAFDLAATDYLLKPISLERFIVAVDKVLGNGQQAAVQDGAEAGGENYLFIKSDGKIFRVLFDEILYAEASGNYTRIAMVSQALLPSMSFSAFEELLPLAQFIRVHRSFIVNKSKIQHIEGNRVFVGEKEIPIGLNYKEEFFKMLGVR